MDAGVDASVCASAAGARLVFSKSSDGTPLDWAAP
jgi:hypothetical protein